MIDELKNLQVEDTIFFTNDQAIDFFEEEELSVTGIKIYSSDDSEMVIVEMDEFFLVAHNFESDEKFFAYQLIAEGETGELEDEGYKFLNDDDDFRHKIAIREDGMTVVYHPSDAGAIYGLSKEKTDSDSDEPNEVAICEYVTNSELLEYILIEREDDCASIMQGFEIEEKDFKINLE